MKAHNEIFTVLVEEGKEGKAKILCVGDIAEIEGKFIGNAPSKITGKVKKIENHTVVIDWSQEYNSRVISINVADIINVNVIQSYYGIY